MSKEAMSRTTFSTLHLRAAAFALVLLAAIVATALCPSLALAMGPALMLFLLLLAGVHPGERTIERLRRQRRPERWPRRALVRRPHVVLVVRRLRQPLTRALITRPPPLPAASFS